VLESRVLRAIFGGKREEVEGNWRKLHSEVLYDWSCLPSIVRVIIYRRDGQCIWHVWGRSEMHTGFWQGKLKGSSCKTTA